METLNQNTGSDGEASKSFGGYKKNETNKNKSKRNWKFTDGITMAKKSEIILRGGREKSGLHGHETFEACELLRDVIVQVGLHLLDIAASCTSSRA